ncbi:MAG: hypothetical protein COA93_06365 [Alphaproteobacteria bacterium]|nr:MAG: hypothetical protein COA93_06365 [Alphaproteobacteria bacterium]
MLIGKIFKLSVISAMVTIFGLSHFAYSDELPKASKRENVDYYEIVLVKYTSGMAGKASDMIRDYFVPAGKAAGTPHPFVMHMQTGQWDSIFFWKQSSMANFDWYISANDEKWYAEFVKQSGSKEKADKIWADYQALIAKTSRQIGHNHKSKEEKAK